MSIVNIRFFSYIFLFFFILVGCFSYSLAEEPLLLKQNEDEFEDHVGNKFEAEMKSRNDSVSATMEGWLLPQYLISERKEEIMKYVVPKGATIGKIIYKKNKIEELINTHIINNFTSIISIFLLNLFQELTYNLSYFKEKIYFFCCIFYRVRAMNRIFLLRYCYLFSNSALFC